MAMGFRVNLTVSSALERRWVSAEIWLFVEGGGDDHAA
jgi:hypothetical protein